MDNMLKDGAASATHHLIFAHGAGAAMDSPFLEKFAALLAGQNLCVHRFEFSYMAGRRTGGSRRPPPKAETLLDEWREAARSVRASLRKGQRLVIGGKSMGGRVASMVAQELYEGEKISGLVCVGYPFHPPAKPAQLRTAHLAHLTCPTLVVQGTRDPFGTREEVAGYALADAIAIAWIENGDHDLKGAGRGTMEKAALTVADFCRGL